MLSYCSWGDPCKRWLVALVAVVSLAGMRPAWAVPAEDPPPDSRSLERAREFLTMDESRLPDALAKIDVHEARALIEQVRSVVREKNPDMDRFYIVIRHLEAMRATELEERRARHLWLVLFITVGLFASYLTYVVLDQRRLLRKLGERGVRPSDLGGQTVYRGEDP